jgi:hypothetical protein
MVFDLTKTFTMRMWLGIISPMFLNQIQRSRRKRTQKRMDKDHDNHSNRENKDTEGWEDNEGWITLKVIISELYFTAVAA